MVTPTASYLKGRGEFGDRYRLGATGYYRIDRKWTLQAGVDYAKYPGAFSSGGGVSFSIGLVFQPDYRRRAEARYQSRDNQAELSYRQSGLNQLNSVGFGGVVTRQDGSARELGYERDSGKRFDASVGHATYGPT